MVICLPVCTRWLGRSFKSALESRPLRPNLRRDLDVLLIMADDFEVDRVASPAREISDAAVAKLRFESVVFRARASIGEEVLQL